LKKTSTNHNNYAVNHKLVLHNIICLFLRQGICIYVVRSFLWNTIGLILLIRVFVLGGE
jgi:hypothetical protein